MLTNHSGYRPWPLRGDAGENQAWSAGATLQFDLRNLPVVTAGNLCNYLLGIAVTFTGTATFSTATGGSPVKAEDLTRALILDSAGVDLQGAWHGRPLAAQSIRGTTLPVIEYVGCGYQYFRRKRYGLNPLSGAGQTFRHTVFLPLAHFFGDKPHHTALPALFYKDAQLIINTATASFATNEAGNTTAITACTVRASAIMLPEPEIRLPPAVEWIEFRQQSQSGSDTVDLDSFGNQTALSGVEPGAGIDTCLIVTSARQQAGSFTLDTLTRFSAPWRDITQTNHIDPIIEMLESASNPNGRSQDLVVASLANTQSATLGGYARDYSDFPYSGRGTGVGSNLDAEALVVPIACPSINLETSKLQVVEGTQTYYRTATVSGTDRTLVHQYKSWTPDKIEDARRTMIEANLPLRVIGTNGVRWSAKMTKKNAENVHPKKTRFFPLRLVPDVPTKA